MHRRGVAARQAGFTLLEVMIALVVLLLGVLGIFGLLNSSIVMNRNSVETSKAAHFAQKRLETIRNTPFIEVEPRGATNYPRLANDDAAADQELQQLGLSGSATWDRQVLRVDSYASGDALKRVVVTVTWGKAGETDSVSLVTYVSRGGLNNTARMIEPSL